LETRGFFVAIKRFYIARIKSRSNFLTCLCIISLVACENKQQAPTIPGQETVLDTLGIVIYHKDIPASPDQPVAGHQYWANYKGIDHTLDENYCFGRLETTTVLDRCAFRDAGCCVIGSDLILTFCEPCCNRAIVYDLASPDLHVKTVVLGTSFVFVDAERNLVMSHDHASDYDPAATTSVSEFITTSLNDNTRDTLLIMAPVRLSIADFMHPDAEKGKWLAALGFDCLEWPKTSVQSSDTR
jgi:hypothetical protein